MSENFSLDSSVYITNIIIFEWDIINMKRQHDILHDICYN